MAFLYQGFTQDSNIRSFQFQHTIESAGVKSSRVEVVVKADLSQLFRAHVAVQDGPALCLHVLAALLANDAAALPLVHHITVQELSNFVGLRAAGIDSAPHRKRRPPKPSSASQIKWPRLV